MQIEACMHSSARSPDIGTSTSLQVQLQAEIPSHTKGPALALRSKIPLSLYNSTVTPYSLSH